MQFGIFYEHQLPRPWQEDSEARLIREALAQVELADRLGIPPTEKRAMWQEAVAQVALMLSETPYPGHDGKYFKMPPRNVVPKPVQKPHPPMWLACSSRPMIHLAAQVGLGALTFAFVDVSEAKHWVADYYDTFKRECTPIAQAVNPNIAMVTGFSCHDDPAEAERRGLEGFQFFGFALAHYYLLGGHVPGRTNVWELFRGNQIPLPGGSGGIGTPEQVRDALHQFEEAGVDQTVFIQQGGNNRHENICASLELFAARVMPEFKERHAARERRKAEELAPHVERALARRTPPREPGELPLVQAYGRDLVSGTRQYPTADRR